MPGLVSWPPYPCHQPILMGDTPPTFLQGGWRRAAPGRTPLAVLSSLVWLRRRCLLRARLVHGEANPISVADHQDGGGGRSSFPGIVWLTLGVRTKISPSRRGGCLSWQGQCSHSLLCCTYHNPLFTSLMPSQTLLPEISSSHHPALSMFEGQL